MFVKKVRVIFAKILAIACWIGYFTYVRQYRLARQKGTVMGDGILNGRADKNLIDKVIEVSKVFGDFAEVWHNLSQTEYYNDIDEDIKKKYHEMAFQFIAKTKMVNIQNYSKSVCYDYLFSSLDRIPIVIEIDEHFRQHGVDIVCEENGQLRKFANIMRMAVMTIDTDI